MTPWVKAARKNKRHHHQQYVVVDQVPSYDGNFLSEKENLFSRFFFEGYMSACVSCLFYGRAHRRFYGRVHRFLHLQESQRRARQKATCAIGRQRSAEAHEETMNTATCVATATCVTSGPVQDHSCVSVTHTKTHKEQIKDIIIITHTIVCLCVYMSVCLCVCVCVCTLVPVTIVADLVGSAALSKM